MLMRCLFLILWLQICWLLPISCTYCTTSLIEVSDEKSSLYSDIISSDDVTAFVMDKNKEVWIGTSYGLNLYDGYRYHQFFHNDKDSLSISDNDIKCLFRDSHDSIWIGTNNGLAKYMGLDRFCPVKHAVKDIYHVENIVETSDGRILVKVGNELCELIDGILVPKLRNLERYFSLETDNDKGFWVLTPMDFFYYDDNYMVKKHITADYWANLVVSMKEDEHTIWVMQSRRISCIDMDTKERIYCAENNLSILPSILFPMQDGILMKSDRDGLFHFNLKTKQLERIDDINMRQPNMISCFYKDTDNNLWIGYHNGGFSFINKSNMTINTINHTALYRGTLDEYVTALASDEEGLIWGGTNSNLFCYNKHLDKIFQFRQEDVFIGDYFYRQTLRKLIPVSNQLWILTNARISLAEYKNERVQVKHSFRTWCLLGDCIVDTDRCYVTADKKFLFTMDKNGVIDSIAVDHPLYNSKGRLLKLHNGNILLITQGLNFMSVDSHTNEIHLLEVNDLSYAGNVLPTCVWEDHSGNIWIGSNGHGLFHLDLEKKEVQSVPSLPALQIMSILEDRDGVLWMGTRKGVMSYSPASHLSYLYAIQVNSGRFLSFNQQCICALGEKIILGGGNGCVAISPSVMRQNATSHLEIRRVFVSKREGKRIALDKENTGRYTFRYNENDLEINFGGVNFGDASYYIYEYKMEGFDRNWISANASHEAFYSNLPTGSYRFKVRAMQSYGSNVMDEKEIAITVLRAPWLSILAWILYGCIFIGLIAYINHLYLYIRSNRMMLQLANVEKERERRTNQMNMSFFANVSHEFRNPLTMIAGPVITLYNDASLPKSVHRRLAMVWKSVSFMLKLIDQMLDFNQLENDVLRLKVGQFDVVYEINLWADVFEESTRERGIALERKGLDKPCYTWLDRDKVDKILGNLFTNALKHTPDKGGVIRITFSVLSAQQVEEDFGCADNAEADYLCIGVFNNGKPIPDEKLSEVFKRYYQIKELNENHRYGWGTGIGLYYVQRLVQLHHGSIKVENLPDGGVEFRFVLPLGETAYRENEHISNEQDASMLDIPLLKDESVLADLQKQNEENRMAQKPKVLIVDDDTRLACYLRLLFCNDYQVVNKYSAESALQEMEQIAPDIILSDVVMGEMSGYDFCRTMKDDVAYSHIPFVLITAKSQINEQIEGLELGANAYVTKPFDPDYLKTLVRSQLKNTENIRKQLNENVQVNPVEGELSLQDRIFMNELYQLMEKHLADLDLNLNTICEELRISRSKLNYKIKGLTGETPNNFFKNYKLNRAARLLREGKNNVSEVAMLTGFSTVSYFSVCFKKQFGVNPSDY